MSKKNLIIPLVISLVMNSCHTTSKSSIEARKQKNPAETVMPANTELDVPFIEAKRYFVKNTYKDGDLVSPKINSQADFEKICGMAPLPGKNGKPTVIDFSKQYVVAIIGQLTDKNTTITVESLKQKDNVILLSYKLIEGEKLSVIIRPLMLLVVDNKYQGEIKLKEN